MTLDLPTLAACVWLLCVVVALVNVWGADHV